MVMDPGFRRDVGSIKGFSSSLSLRAHSSESKTSTTVGMTVVMVVSGLNLTDSLIGNTIV